MTYGMANGRGYLLCSGFAADPDYWKGEVFAFVGLPQNLKDLKDLKAPIAPPSHQNKGPKRTGELNAIPKQKCFICSPFHGRACRWDMLGELNPTGPKGPKPF